MKSWWFGGTWLWQHLYCTERLKFKRVIIIHLLTKRVHFCPWNRVTKMWEQNEDKKQSERFISLSCNSKDFSSGWFGKTTLITVEALATVSVVFPAILSLHLSLLDFIQSKSSTLLSFTSQSWAVKFKSVLSLLSFQPIIHTTRLHPFTTICIWTSYPEASTADGTVSIPPPVSRLRMQASHSLISWQSWSNPLGVSSKVVLGTINHFISQPVFVLIELATSISKGAFINLGK